MQVFPINTAIFWISGIIAVIVTIIFGTIYVTNQQMLRQGANDTQIQMVGDARAAIASGQAPSAVIPNNTINIAASSSPFMIIFDGAGNVITGNARFNGVIPTIPSGIFDYVRVHGQDRVTWQPAIGVRSAIVVERYSANGREGFVLAGRSLTEVEKHEHQLFILALLGWFVCMIVIAGSAFMITKKIAE